MSETGDNNAPRTGGTASRELTLFELIGGEPAVHRLVETFYDIVETEPEGRALHVLHLKGHGVAHSRLEQFNFLTGFFGGPKLYAEKYGHSDVRKMHAHVEIGAEARDAWLNCMAMAIDRMNFADGVKQRLMEPFTRVAQRLQNQE